LSGNSGGRLAAPFRQVRKAAPLFEHPEPEQANELDHSDSKAHGERGEMGPECAPLREVSDLERCHAYDEAVGDNDITEVEKLYGRPRKMRAACQAENGGPHAKQMRLASHQTSFGSSSADMRTSESRVDPSVIAPHPRRLIIRVRSGTDHDESERPPRATTTPVNPSNPMEASTIAVRNSIASIVSCCSPISVSLRAFNRESSSLRSRVAVGEAARQHRIPSEVPGHLVVCRGQGFASASELHG
jgi:hypothetical protein